MVQQINSWGVKYLLLYVTSDHVDYKCTLIFTVDLSQDETAALHAACPQGHDRVAELLLQAGASVDEKAKVRCRVGYSAFMNIRDNKLFIVLSCQ